MIHFSRTTLRNATGKIPPGRFITPLMQLRLCLHDNGRSIGQITVSLGPETPPERARKARDLLIRAILEKRLPNTHALDLFCRALKREIQNANTADKIPPRRQGLKRNTGAQATRPNL